LKEHEGFFAVSCCIGTFATPFTVGWLIGNLVIWVPALRERRIMRKGEAVVGSVAQKVEVSNKRGTEHVIWYRFGAADGKTWGDKARVSRIMFDGLKEGQAVIVVYLKDRPGKSVLYEASHYRPA